MKLSEAKALIKDAAGRSTEAFGELKNRLSDLQQQIDELIEGVGDPEVTDEEFIANLNTLKANTDALADLVPNVVPEPPTA